MEHNEKQLAPRWAAAERAEDNVASRESATPGRRNVLLYALVALALTACTIFDVDQLARKGWERGAELFYPDSAPSQGGPSDHGRLDELVGARVGDVAWGPCGADEHAVPGAECGYAIVPLDYSDEGAGVAKIALGRYNATGTRKGSLFINPGGPGGSGVRLATRAGPYMQSIVGAGYDIVGFDPRGIGKTEPETRCFTEPGSRLAFLQNTVLERGFDTSANFSDPINRARLIEAQRDANALFQTQFAVCTKTLENTIRYMGTTTVARDIDYMTTLLDGEDAMINFYGWSYGTVIGQYLANMFPHRVGHIAIDGMVDAEQWTTDSPYKWFNGGWLSSTDNVYDLFFEDCAKAGPSGCALAKTEDEDPADIKARMESFVNGLLERPLPVPNATHPGILTQGRVRYFQLDMLCSPLSWPTAASSLAAALAGDASAILDAVAVSGSADLQRSAVTCNDVAPFAPPPAEAVVDALLAASRISRFAFAIVTHEPDNGCEFWPVAPPERFAGPWNATLRAPILIVSNTLDPDTSLANGRAVRKRMGKNAGMVVQNGPGHCSLALPSACTVRHMRAYFADNTLPPDDTLCEVDVPPFPGVSAQEFDAETLAVHESVRKVAELIRRTR
ncbi:TAP-like protein-domain-containing protein [Epithele typhae]|uniref:TAP-like protein-domain-containing protein n=1 Tax=Epithele typhae TaxID=378194 RepID=UPI0020084218|nr:TAP-like protein-domain-containing protein [Epithele typhae]KAH9928003.1 TAP-like protein-domain-containing protein [Epithele typhae]